jgi:hypothetical protein
VTKQPRSSSLPPGPAIGSTMLLVVVLLLGALMALPATAFAQTPAGTPGTPAPVPAASLTMSQSSGVPGDQVTATGSGFKATENVDVTMNGASVGSAPAGADGTFNLSFKVPNQAPGQYAVVAKQASGASATTSFTVSPGKSALTFSVAQAAPGTSLTVTSGGFQPGETVTLSFNSVEVGSATADTSGAMSVTFVVPTVDAGQYEVMAMGEVSKTITKAFYTVIVGPTPVPAAAPTATPVPAAAPTPVPVAAPPNAPAIVHDDRYFSQTGYRIDNDQVWAFFQQYGGLSTFGYPVSRQMSFLGCPVQMFQRQIIQVCQGQGAALINMLDPEIFPYTQVNGSTFPAPDATMKNNTPQVGSPTYADDMNAFITANVPDTALGQPVNFNLTFNSLGGLTIWGAPISAPQADPGNANFIYQRFQRGIMHYVVGQGTQSILLADYLKAILMNKDVPPDLAAQSHETRFFGQYSPGSTLWLARPNDLPGTDLTYAFVNG